MMVGGVEEQITLIKRKSVNGEVGTGVRVGERKDRI